MLFFFYCLFSLVNIIIYKNLNFFNKIYLYFYWINLIDKRNFKDISFFEKFVLIFVKDKNWFNKSNFNYFSEEDIFNYRLKNFPILNFFILYTDKTEFREKFNFFLNSKKNYKFFKSKTFFKKSFIEFLILLHLFSEKYYIILNKLYYKNYNNYNLYKLNFLFFFFNSKNFKKKKFFNLKYYSDWYSYNFNRNLNRKFSIKNTKNSLYQIFKKKKNDNILKVFKKYSSRLNVKNFFKLDYPIFNFFKNTKNYKMIFFKKLKIKKNNLKKKIPIRFSETSLNKYINKYNLSNYSFYFLRKNKIFNKSRYSRNRQLYRTGVYWCLWLNIMIVYGLYFLFYRFSFNFGYIWIGMFLLLFSTIFSRSIKYKFYNLYYLFEEFFNLYKWTSFFLKNFLFNIKSFFFKDGFFLKNFLISHFFKLYYFFYKYFISLIKFVFREVDHGYVFLWKSYKEVYGVDDDSFLKWKSKILWISIFIKVLRY